MSGAISNFNGSGTAGVLRKNGAGTLVLSSSSSSYTGRTETMSGGVLSVAKLANGVLRMAEGPDAVFSGGKRAHEDEEERPAPVLGGRKSWVYTYSTGRGGGRGGRGGGTGDRGGAAGRGLPAGRFGGGTGYQSGGYNKRR